MITALIRSRYRRQAVDDWQVIDQVRRIEYSKGCWADDGDGYYNHMGGGIGLIRDPENGVHNVYVDYCDLLIEPAAGLVVTVHLVPYGGLTSIYFESQDHHKKAGILVLGRADEFIHFQAVAEFTLEETIG